MTDTSLPAPQLVVHSRMLYTSWIPADPRACAALLPPALQPAANGAVYMNQYVVDSEDQTTGFGAYSLTYLGIDLAGPSAPDGVTPGRFFTHYFNSAEKIRAYVGQRGVPATPGTTTVEIAGETVTATTYFDGKPLIRTRARAAGLDTPAIARGHLRYVTRVGNRLASGLYPYIGKLASSFEVRSIEFLDPSHPVHALRPATPLAVVPAACFYSPDNSFVYPGGEEDLGPADRHHA
ncbi:MAG TPA: hypothetical protein VNM90_17955 [Haliangium sp.]|nr:hypothetical protein [Haliangium sp.]